MQTSSKSYECFKKYSCLRTNLKYFVMKESLTVHLLNFQVCEILGITNVINTGFHIFGVMFFFLCSDRQQGPVPQSPIKLILD